MGGTRLQDALDRVEKISATVRDGAAESERLGRLAPAVFDALQETGLFRILVPVDRGGLDLTLPEAIEVITRVGTLDASTAASCSAAVRPICRGRPTPTGSWRRPSSLATASR